MCVDMCVDMYVQPNQLSPERGATKWSMLTGTGRQAQGSASSIELAQIGQPRPQSINIERTEMLKR